ncbi:glutathione S-transferase U17-like [Coffea eugenioides]|uniref:glutathione S-transferase U17-like n=1 Tax=Coffea eugenioides TaxID=49369 RepID=UPI000F60E9F8|nr:glutathione S-transferase U17-like [Coffea eugenioides]
MVTNGVKLLDVQASQFVNRVQVALNLKSIDYEFIPQNLSEKRGLLLQSNPAHKSIRCIDDFSSDGPSILPSDPYDRGIARFRAAYIDEKWLTFFRELPTATDEESQSGLVERILRGLIYFEEPRQQPWWGWAETYLSDRAVHGVVLDTEEFLDSLQIIIARAVPAAPK